MTENSNQSPDQAETLRSLNATMPTQEYNEITRVYSITSGKGGVGKTAVVANTAVSLAKLGKKVLVLDADLGLANIDVVFGLTPTHNLNHFFSGERGLEDVMVDGPYGIKILPAGSGLQNFIRLDASHKLRLLEGLDGIPASFDYVLIDTEAGISENVTYFNTAAQEIMIVTTPEPTAITDAYALMKLLSVQFHEKNFNLLVNMVQNDNDALDVYRKLTMVSSRYLDISIDFLGSIPADKQMNECIRKQKVISDLYPASKVATAFSSLAERITMEQTGNDPKGNLQFFWKKLLRFGDKQNR